MVCYTVYFSKLVRMCCTCTLYNDRADGKKTFISINFPCSNCHQVTNFHVTVASPRQSVSMLKPMQLNISSCNFSCVRYFFFCRLPYSRVLSMHSLLYEYAIFYCVDYPLNNPAHSAFESIIVPKKLL